MIFSLEFLPRCSCPGTLSTALQCDESEAHKLFLSKTFLSLADDKPLFRPYGTQINFPPSQDSAFAPSWAISVPPCGLHPSGLAA